MIKIKTTAEIVEMSELYEVCERAGLGRELEASEQTLTDLLFDEVCYSDGEYKRLNCYDVKLYEDELEELEEMPEEVYNDNKDYILYLRCMIAIKKALKEAGVDEYILVEIGV